MLSQDNPILAGGSIFHMKSKKFAKHYYFYKHIKIYNNCHQLVSELFICFFICCTTVWPRAR